MIRDSKDPKPNGKRVALIFGYWALSPLLLLVLLVVEMTTYNNFRLHRFEQNFAALPHPVGTKLLRRKSRLDTFGNGHHCDFLVTELRSYPSNPKFIQNFYRTMRVAVPSQADADYQEIKNGAQPIQMELLPSPLPRKYHWRFPEDWNLSDLAGRRNLYIVYVLNSGEDFSWDSTFCLNCG